MRILPFLRPVLYRPLLLVALLSTVLLSCHSDGSEGLQRDELIYSNDFETGEGLEAIDGVALREFNNTTVLGNFNNDGFTLHLDSIGDHDYIYLSFDLYIHDSWDGNFNNFEQDQPDSWFIELRPDMDLYPGAQFSLYKTTFSNSVCNAVYCLRQSFPNLFPFENKPRMGAAESLPGLCSLAAQADGTSLYRIEKGFQHSGNALIVRFYDTLYQPNAVDEKCDESWSMDNLKVRVIRFE